MNILNKLTLKHLTMNKKRTIVTIIGILLSTALMVGIGTISSTFIGYMIEDAKIINGSHHVTLTNVESDKLKYIKHNTDIKEYSIYSFVGYAPLEGSKNNYKPYLYILGADESFLKTSKLIEGRLPKNDNELLISKHILTNGKVKLKIGDKITLNVGNRYIDDEQLDQYNPYIENEVFKKEYEKEYTITGIMERRNDENYSAPGYTVLTLEDMKNSGVSNIRITYNRVKNVKQKTIKIAKNVGIYSDDYELVNANIDYNDSLLSYYGESSYDSINDMFVSIVAIVLSLIMVGCAIVIYNSFAISVMERKKQFGLFSSIGATRKQLRKTVFYEAFIVSVIGIPLGILSGIFGIWVVVEIMNYLFPAIDPKFHLIIIPMYIILPIIYMILTIVISAILPARRASKISPIEAIRLNDDIKVKKKQIKTNHIVRKIFGIEGELALKNMKRNKKKYRITILSLIVSIVLFLSFSAFLEYGFKSSSSFYEVSNYDISITFNNNKLGIDDYNNVISKLQEIDSIKEMSSGYYRSLASDDNDYNMSIRKIMIELDLSKDHYKYYGLDEKNGRNVELGSGFLILPDDEYREYIKELKLDYRKYSGDELIIICTNTARYMDYNKGKIYEYKLYDESKNKVDAIFRSYSYRSIVEEEDKYLDNKVSIPITYVDKTPKLTNGNLFVISQKMYKKVEELFPKVDYEGTYYETLVSQINLKVKDHSKTEEDIKKVLNITNNNGNGDFSLYNIRADEEEERNSVLLIAILLYGFISLVTLIGVTSVFNTINTSIALRRKEFAVLRSIGLTPKGFNRMIRYESLLYGLKALMIGIPISVVVMFLIKNAFNNVVSFKIFIPIKPLIICVLGVFIITFITMMYATSKIKRENILDAIREENI